MMNSTKPLIKQPLSSASEWGAGLGKALGYIGQMGQIASRPLTSGEIDMAQAVFADQIDYTAVTVRAVRWIMRCYAMSPNGDIYFNPNDMRPDFSREDLSTRSWFIHELTHVWQFQQGMAVVRRALFDRRYRYNFKPEKQFTHYGLEQQAQIVQDYYTRQQVGLSCHDLAQCLPFLPKTV